MSTLRRSLYYLLISLYLLTCIITVHSQSATHYKTLNVPKHATTKEIRKAFKSLALKYHPDRNLASSDPERMKTITAAYEVLGDPNKRKKYDEEQRQHNIFAAHGFGMRRGGGASDGIGASLTNYNYYNLLYNINDLPWLIFATEDFCQACKAAKSIFEDACIKLSGMARCAKADVNKESSLINEFSLRRVPHFIIFYNHNGQIYKKNIGWRGRDKIKIHTLIDAVADIFPKKCSIIKTEIQMKEFISDIKFTDDYYNKVKAIIFSDAKNRHSPHILLQYLATRFEENIDFGYIHMDTARTNKLSLVYRIALSIGLDSDDLEPPSMYILRSPLIHNKLISIDELQTLEDIGIYHVSLSSDVDSMVQFVEQYALPTMPKIDADNYLKQCFFTNSLENIDQDKICYLFTVNNEIEKDLANLFLFGQYILAQLTETVQFGWVNCKQQNEFCKSINIITNNNNNMENNNDIFSVKLVAIKAYQDYYQLYENGENMLLKKEEIEDIVNWISLLEKDDIVFGDDENVCNESDFDKNCKKLNSDSEWKNGILFPIKTPKWADSIDNVLGGIGNVFGFIGDGIGAGFSAVGTILSSIFQIVFVIIVFLFLLPMLRGR